MNTHELKITNLQFDQLAIGKMRAQVRYNDRDFAAGDMLILKEWEPVIKKFTGRTLPAKVLHVWKGDGLAEGFVLLTVRALK